jgi:lysophospholipase L1-like esterase
MQPGLISIRERMKSSAPMKWLFTGDSITHGALHTWGQRDYVEHFAERLRYEMGRKRDMVITTAISGWSTQNIRDDIDWNILQFDADVVSIMIGMNDSCMGPEGLKTFRENYFYIIDRVQKMKKAAILLHTPNPIWPEANDRRGALPEYVEEIRRIAKDRQLPLIDHWTYWADTIRENSFRAVSWMNDSIHPGPYGHLAFTHLLLKELDLWDNTSNVCRFFVP